ncbi:MAG: hypothetical protein QM401_04165 [Bacillota bacterium]|nr:hypothetical protein [Bacillota bacterium]
MSRDLEMAVRLLKRAEELIPLEPLLALARGNQYKAKQMQLVALMTDIREFLDTGGSAKLEILCTNCRTDLNRDNSRITLRISEEEDLIGIYLVCYGCGAEHWFVDFDSVTLEVQ